MKVEKAKLKFYILVAAIILILAVSAVLHFMGYHVQIYDLVAKLKNNQYLPLLYVGLYIISSFFPLPFLTFLGALIFHFYVVLVYCLVGNIISFILMFYLTRWLGRDYVALYEERHKKLKDLDLKLQKNAFWDIFFLRFFYLIPPEFINIMAGLSRIEFKDYLVASVLGSLPVLITSIGLIKAYQIKSMALFIVCSILMILYIIIPLLYVKGLKNFFRRKKDSKDDEDKSKDKEEMNKK